MGTAVDKVISGEVVSIWGLFQKCPETTMSRLIKQCREYILLYPIF